NAVCPARLARVRFLRLVHQWLTRCCEQQAGTEAMTNCYELVRRFKSLLPHCTQGAQDFREHRRLSNPVRNGFLRPKGEIVQQTELPRRIPCDINTKQLLVLVFIL